MSKRFRDEFFKKGNSAHDALVTFCYSEVFANMVVSLLKTKEKIPTICPDIVENPEIFKPLFEFLEKLERTGIKDVTILSRVPEEMQKETLMERFWYCIESPFKNFVNKETKYCHTPWRAKQYCFQKLAKEEEDEEWDLMFSRQNVCKFFNIDKYEKWCEKQESVDVQTTIEPIGKVMEGFLVLDTINVIPYCYESEKICKSGKFIVGYIDILYHVRILQLYCLIHNSFPPIKKFTHRIKHINLIIEVKPKLESWGAALRQIKTYMDLEKDKLLKTEPFTTNVLYGLIVSHDTLSPEEIDILEQEKVFFIHVPKDQLDEGTPKTKKKELDSYLPK